MKNYYVYQLIDPRNDKPFYVGEGKGRRAYSHLEFKSGCVNPHKDRVIKKIQELGLEVRVEFVHTNLTKDQSRHLEGLLIENIGLENLTNICKNANPPQLVGPDNGFYGKTHSDEVKKKLGDVNRGKDLKSSEGKRNISNALKARWADPMTRERQIQVLKSRKGEKRSEAAKESYRISAAKRNEKMTPEQRSARTIAGAMTKKIKYAGLRRKSYIDENGKKRFRYIPSTD
jgi:hypothetical protein